MVKKKRIDYFVRMGSKISPLGSPLSCVITNSDPQDGFFYPKLKLMTFL